MELDRVMAEAIKVAIGLLVAGVVGAVVGLWRRVRAHDGVASTVARIDRPDTGDLANLRRAAQRYDTRLREVHDAHAEHKVELERRFAVVEAKAARELASATAVLRADTAAQITAIRDEIRSDIAALREHLDELVRELLKGRAGA